MSTYFVVGFVVFGDEADDVVFGILGDTRDEVGLLVFDDVCARFDGHGE